MKKHSEIPSIIQNYFQNSGNQKMVDNLACKIESFFKEVCHMKKVERNKVTEKLLNLLSKKMTKEKNEENKKLFNKIKDDDIWSYNDQFQHFYLPSILYLSYIYEMTTLDGRENSVFIDLEKNKAFFKTENEELIEVLSFESTPLKIRSMKGSTTQSKTKFKVKKYLVGEVGKPLKFNKQQVPFDKDFKKHPEIRILPMSKKLKDFEGATIEEVQYFFKNGFISRNKGAYRYQEQGINALEGSLVLFQFDNHIIASAEYIRDDKEKRKLYFKIDTVNIVTPISGKEIKEFWKDFNGFTQAKHRIPEEYANCVYKILEIKTIEDDELDEYFDSFFDEDEVLVPEVKPEKVPSKKETEREQRKRSQKQKSIAKKRASFKCEIDAQHKTFINKSGKNFIECHHLIPLKYQDEFKYSLDVFANIVCLCPLCHRIIHNAKNSEKEVAEIYKKRIKDLKKAGIEISKEKLLSYYR